MGRPSWRTFLTGCHDVAAAVRFWEKYSSAVLVCCSPDRSTPCSARECSCLCGDLNRSAGAHPEWGGRHRPAGGRRPDVLRQVADPLLAEPPHHGQRAASIGPVPAARMNTLETLAGHLGLRQTGSRVSPPWAVIAQITKMSRVMRSSDQNG